MFVQVFSGKITDASEARAALDRWAKDLAAGASGWLGSTAGVTEDGTLVGTARFESEEQARRNSERPEQDAWWAEFSKLFTEEPTFRESSEVDVDLRGDPDSAGFVQLILGRTSDPARARELMNADADAWAAFRPDILASLGLDLGGGDYAAILYFTSEAEARAGERKEPPDALRAQMEGMQALEIGEPRFLDLKEPWLLSPSAG